MDTICLAVRHMRLQLVCILHGRWNLDRSGIVAVQVAKLVSESHYLFGVSLNVVNEHGVVGRSGHALASNLRNEEKLVRIFLDNRVIENGPWLRVRNSAILITNQLCLDPFVNHNEQHFGTLCVWI